MNNHEVLKKIEEIGRRLPDYSFSNFQTDSMAHGHYEKGDPQAYKHHYSAKIARGDSGYTKWIAAHDCKSIKEMLDRLEYEVNIILNPIEDKGIELKADENAETEQAKENAV